MFINKISAKFLESYPWATVKKLFVIKAYIPVICPILDELLTQQFKRKHTPFIFYIWCVFLFCILHVFYSTQLVWNLAILHIFIFLYVIFFSDAGIIFVLVVLNRYEHFIYSHYVYLYILVFILLLCLSYQ